MGDRGAGSVAGAGVLGAGLLSACDQKPRPPASQVPCRRTSPPRLGGSPWKRSAPACAPRRAAQFRGVQVYQQADPRVIAVCGQVNPAGRQDQAFIPFVSVVTYARRPEAGLSEFESISTSELECRGDAYVHRNGLPLR